MFLFNKHKQSTIHLKSSFLSQLKFKKRSSEPSSKKPSKSNTSSKKRFIPIKFNLVGMCIAFAIIPLLIINLISTSVSRQALSTTTSKLTGQTIKQAANNIETTLDSIENIVVDFVVSITTQSATFNQCFSNDTFVKLKAKTALQSELISLSSLYRSFNDVAVVCENQDLYVTGSTIPHEDLFEVFNLELGNDLLWKVGLGSSSDHLFVIKPIGRSKNTQGVFCGDINTTQITNTLKDIELLDNSLLLLVDPNKNILYSSVPENTTIEDEFWSTIHTGESFASTTLDSNLITYATLSNGWILAVKTPLASLTNQLQAATLLTWSLILLTSILAVLVGLTFANKFSKPIIELMKLMKQTENGDLTVSITPKGHNEITQLCQSFNVMVHNMKGLLHQTQSVIADTLKDSEVLSSSTKQSVETFNELAHSVEDIAAGTTQQAEDAQEGTSSMITLSDSIQTVSQKCNVIFQNAQGATHMIQEATHTIEQLNQTMASSIQISGDINTSILELEELNKGIESIMHLLDGISGQTNLLALNASIEAARAGEAGKGFAVVAQEVRNLSEQSKASTINVRQELTKIADKTDSTMSLIQKSNTIFNAQSQSVEKTSSLFSQIIKALQQITTDLEDINQETQDMEKLKAQTAQKIENIASVTEESAAATEQISALSEEQKAVMEGLSKLSMKLTEAMDGLQKAIQVFKL
ncbi:hypothetical protein CS063_01215 [Sporanaerobium hydrogeniformans]|uniref:Uncharacterized protein n=1 Tax=Sporanaerobium hydrogeniformans TaxID=3072179 RepID=A0AC61DIJ2_9FIRM|nr:methyl-accepting chemotaxis protein [Sporanaerobium hydrogeniformans]PHV72127.1 hypothetical protein CS063_01215 [Sporanaerobium hydrogeniformans]